MARIDGRTQAEFAIPGTLLMEDAGVKSWAAVRRQVWDGRKPRGRLVFLAGKGNNGGDAFVMARQAAVERTGPLTIILAAGRPAAGADPASWIKPAGAPLTFRTTGQQKDVTLAPINSIFGKRYSLYWQVS